jgi:hypothetical protein
MFNPRIPTGWIALLMICFLHTAKAEEGKDAALTCFEDAKTLFKDAKYKEAADKFREAYTLKPSWKLLYNIGQSEAAAKQYGLALEAFEQFLSEGGDDIGEARRDEVLREVERLRKMVGYLLIKAPQGTQVFIDNERRGTAPVRTMLAISAGVDHAVRGELEGAVIFSDNYKVIGGQTMEVELQETSGLVKAPVPQPAGPPALSVEQSKSGTDSSPVTAKATEEGQAPVNSVPHKGGFPFVTVGWIVAAVGAGAAIGGAVLGGLALSKNSDLNRACGDGPCPEKTDDVNARDHMALSSTVLIAAGGTVLAAGAALLIVGKIKEKRNRENPTISLLPAVDRTSMGASFEWRF